MRSLALLLALLLFSLPAHADQLQEAKADMLGQGKSDADYKTAASHLLPLVAQGDAEAAYQLAFLYHDGKGVKQDVVTSNSLMHAAADQGYKQAQLTLGRMLAHDGQSKDYVAAYMWLRLSDRKGEKFGTEMLADLVPKMTPEQLKEAKHLVAGWKAKPHAVAYVSLPAEKAK